MDWSAPRIVELLKNDFEFLPLSQKSDGHNR